MKILVTILKKIKIYGIDKLQINFLISYLLIIFEFEQLFGDEIGSKNLRGQIINITNVSLKTNKRSQRQNQETARQKHSNYLLQEEEKN